MSLHILVSSLLDADADMLLWRGHPFSRDPLLGIYEISEANLQHLRIPFLRSRLGRWQRSFQTNKSSAVIFRNGKDILAKSFQRPAEAAAEGLGNISDVLRTQKLDPQLVYRLLGCLLSSMRDQLDALQQKQEHAQYDQYGKLCRDIVKSLKEDIGPVLANERTIPNLRLLAGTVS